MSGIGLGLAGLSSAQKMARIGIAVGAVVLVVLLIWWRVDAYGDSREQAGVDKERAAWVDASNKLKEQAALTATKADDRAALRLEEFKEQADEDREAVDEAVRDGGSPLDALFGR